MCDKVLSAETQEILSTKIKRDELVGNRGNLPRFNIQYGIIKYDPNNDTFVIKDKNRKIFNDSFIGFIDVEAVSLKGDLSSEGDLSSVV